MTWLHRILDKCAGPTRATQLESERSWTFTGLPALLVLIAYYELVAFATRWLVSLQITDRELLWLILFVLIVRR